MNKDNLIHQLHELGSIKRAPALWREQTRSRLLKQIEVTAFKPFSLAERLVYGWQQTRLTLAPMHLAPVIATVLIMVIGYSPFSAALATSLPGSPLYPVKRLAEKFELSLRSSSDSQGLFYLTLAGRRLSEVKAVSGADVATQAELFRDYNINLGFAQASLETGLLSTDLAKTYDQATDILAANLNVLTPAPANRQVYKVALDLTSKVSSRALALLVSQHGSNGDGVRSAEVANRLATEIAKVEAKLEGVEAKIQLFPENSPAPRVVITSKATVVPVAEASKQAKDNLAEAKELIARNEFGLALQKVQESEDLTEKSEAAVTEEETTTEEEAKSETELEETPATETGEVKGDSNEPTEDPAKPTSEVVPQPESGGAGEVSAPTMQIDRSVSTTPAP